MIALAGEEGAATEPSEFMQEIERPMAQKGLTDLQELYESFLDQKPERIGNARWTFERFVRHANHEAGALYPEFVRPLIGALRATKREQEWLFLAWVEDAVDGSRVAYPTHRAGTP